MTTFDHQCRKTGMSTKRNFMLTLAAVSILFYYGCSENQSVNSFADSDSNSTILEQKHGMNEIFNQADRNLIIDLKRATARFHSTQQAAKEGYVVTSHCVVAQNPELGAMGYHWANQSLVDPVFDPGKPEAVLYEPDANGNLTFVAVEYIIIDIGQDHPHFGDHPFDIGGTPIPVPHYSLHVWLYKNNPNGLFTPYNPNVVCPDE
jgi:hypothetical protein